jgi:hypothetical protein
MPIQKKSNKKRKVARCSSGQVEYRVRQFARCEDCEKKINYKRATGMNGWWQTGKSKWGKRYCSDGLAWHCGKELPIPSQVK